MEIPKLRGYFSIFETFRLHDAIVPHIGFLGGGGRWRPIVSDTLLSQYKIYIPKVTPNFIIKVISHQELRPKCTHANAITAVNFGANFSAASKSPNIFYFHLVLQVTKE